MKKRPKKRILSDILINPEAFESLEDLSQIVMNSDVQQTTKLSTNIDELDKMIAQYEHYKKCEGGDYCVSPECLHKVQGLQFVDKDKILERYGRVQRMRDFVAVPHNNCVVPEYSAGRASEDFTTEIAVEDSAGPRIHNDTINTRIENSTGPYIYRDIIGDTPVWDSSRSDIYEGTTSYMTAADSAGPSRSCKSQMAIEDPRELARSQEPRESLTEALQRIMILSSTNDGLDRLIAKCEKYEECEELRLESKRCEKGGDSSDECLHRVQPKHVRKDFIVNWLRHMQRMRVIIPELLYMCCARTPMPREWQLRFAQLRLPRIGFARKASKAYQQLVPVFNRCQDWNFQELLPPWARTKPAS
eukprot:Gregarina_sp_Poly_1__4742@NODE_2532_length_2015_cov_14_882444_g1608_i0_p1_GENE_NODE_2532_length_2015_cov_14_882444_g1608_i0NODE_2532_length_2015_cov_14_882444_g1608_i0_p1_ORF_typecomplete_len360_score25_09DUF155/PF02582_14/0_27_NODE_2532_length_2015_cov_14_882444_g1608_i01351214